MEYSIVKCPKCEKELPVPEDLKNCICMYCGEHFRIEKQQEKPEQEVNTSELEEAYQQKLAQVGRLLEEYQKLLLLFTAEAYGKAFLEYVKLGEELLIPADRYAMGSEEQKSQVTEEISAKLMLAVGKNVGGKKGILSANTSAKILDQYRFFLAVYLIPMLSYLKLSISEALAARIMEDWKMSYPKYEFRKASFDELEDGFRRKGFCFITTAVCDTLNKPDDCDELMLFRKFRDQYLRSSENGSELIEEYYRIAPKIVAYLNMQTNSEEKYRKLWKKDLVRCLNYIEKDRNEQCKKAYIRMVRRLEKQLPFE